MFIKDFTKGTKVHIEDLIARIKRIAQDHFSQTGQSLDDDIEAFSFSELRRTDYFAKFQ